MSIKVGLLSVLLFKTCVREKGGLGSFAPQMLTRSYYFEPPRPKNVPALLQTLIRILTCSINFVVAVFRNPFIVLSQEDLAFQ